MHYEAFKFVQSALKYLPLDRKQPLKIIDIGSLDINGSLRPLFNKYLTIQQYVGVDVAPGRGVDLVALGENLDLPDASFDIAVSSECFEHNPEWVKTFANMHRMLRAGGLMIITCASTGRAEHGTENSEPESSPLTQDKWGSYYKNLNEDDFKEVFNLGEMFSRWRFYYNPESKDLYFIGYKKADKDKEINLDEYARRLNRRRFYVFRIIWRLMEMAHRKFRR